jgi:hypothetical protein
MSDDLAEIAVRLLGLQIQRNGLREGQDFLRSIEMTFVVAGFDLGRNARRGFAVICPSRSSWPISGNRSPEVPDVTAFAAVELEGHFVNSKMVCTSSGGRAIRLPRMRHAPSFFAGRRRRFTPQPISLANSSGEMA